jgi:cysteine desulfurase
VDHPADDRGRNRTATAPGTIDAMGLAYLDNAATTRVDPDVLAALLPWLADEYGNPSSIHALGVRARAAIERAREQVARAIIGRSTPPAKPRVVFTGSGTEANHLAIHGFTERRGDRLVASAVEHPSVRAACERLAAKRGIEFVTVAVDRHGRLDLAALRESLTRDTLLVAVMHVQNELGTIQPIAETAQLVRELAPRAHFHVDAIQSLGKVALDEVVAHADSLAISAHKIHGPKGVGALVQLSRRPLVAQIVGGGQESGARSGTENVAGIVGFGLAADRAWTGLDAHRATLEAQRARIAHALTACPGVELLGPADPSLRSPAILAATIRGVAGEPLRGETIQHELESRGVIVGTGSACHAAHGALSPTFGAIGLSEARARSLIRISLSRTTTADDVAAFAAAFAPALERLTALLT